MRTTLKATAVAAAMVTASAANAAIGVLFDAFDDGFANFANTVTAAGGTQTNQVLTAGGTPGNADFTISRPSGGVVSISSAYTLSGSTPTRTTTGGVVDISPGGSGSNPLNYGNSGITFNFDNRGAGVFVAAFDDSDTFSTVSFGGDGVGEVLNAGGTIRYSALQRGSLPPTGAVPEPAPGR